MLEALVVDPGDRVRLGCGEKPLWRRAGAGSLRGRGEAERAGDGERSEKEEARPRQHALRYRHRTLEQEAVPLPTAPTAGCLARLRHVDLSFLSSLPHAVLAPVVDRFEQSDEDDRDGFRATLAAFERLYSFLSQIITFTDPELEKIYVWASLLRRKLPTKEGQLPVEVQQSIEVESLRVEKTGARDIELEKKNVALDPMRFGAPVPTSEELAPLSRIIEDLNEHFGLDLNENDRVTAYHLLTQLEANPGLNQAMDVNPKEIVRLSFDKLAGTLFQEIMESNLGFYKQLQNTPELREVFFRRLFEEYVSRYNTKAA
jgi:hypothetical protein